jgi:branched-chain amino acid transport system permease protein
VHYFIELAIQGLIHGAIYALIALGLTMIFGLLRILHIAHAAFYTLGGYIAIGVVDATNSIIVGTIVAALVTGIAGVAAYWLFYRPLLSRPPEVVLIASIGLLIAMQEGFRICFGAYGKSYSSPPLRELFTFSGITISAAELSTLIIATALFLGLALFVTRTRFGIACRATVSDPTMASLFGISVTQVRVFTFFVGSAFAGIAGTFSGALNNIVEPTMGAVPSYKALAIIVIGGFGDVRGTLVAALLVGLVEAFGTVYLTAFMDRDAIAFALLLIILFIRPQGLFAS